jgi:hypothetical protein
VGKVRVMEMAWEVVRKGRGMVQEKKKGNNHANYLRGMGICKLWGHKRLI